MARDGDHGRQGGHLHPRDGALWLVLFPEMFIDCDMVSMSLILANMYPEREDDPAPLKQARRDIGELVHTWIAEART